MKLFFCCLLNTGDSIMDIRQFLLDAPETSFFTCYDLLLHTKDGSTHHLEDYNEISEVGDISTGGFSLEMIADSVRTEVPELDDLGFMEDVSGFQVSSVMLQPRPTHQALVSTLAPYKVNSDFVDAAIGGATGVINRCIPPVKPNRSRVLSYEETIHANVEAAEKYTCIPSESSETYDEILFNLTYLLSLTWLEVQRHLQKHYILTESMFVILEYNDSSLRATPVRLLSDGC
ncbi:hypothetical protein K2173_012399 [Erythroxylum novogranatense]|uniref:Clustered mitochondria protein N-terminal domain-containing protein n=1 Tax=Erythroxylum novogranatense TaxID=1862640 RepID=A0AAV8U9W9_9ROSI|nr:hypothetical protein K2173_012399 [Erythroxylum novogranatense]